MPRNATFEPQALRANMSFQLASGVLLHVTSLPGHFGIGDLGPEAFRFVDWLADSGQTYWQFLPLGPLSEGGSPYQSLSVFAGNPLLISPVALAEAGLLGGDELRGAEAEVGGGTHRVDFLRVEAVKSRLLARAGKRFAALPAAHPLRREFDDFCFRQAAWLDNFTRFMALRDANDRQAWTCWRSHVDARKEPLPGTFEELRPRVDFHGFVQWAFERQWQALRRYANSRGIRLIGDLPIYVSHDGADVWSSRELFQLDEEGRPTAVAGVPPDYFSETGQLWNNPLYDWRANRQQGYQWWIRRVRTLLDRVDAIRLDHFRGYQAYWEVPAGAPTAEVGRWVAGPGEELFHAIEQSVEKPNPRGIGSRATLPLIAENLGVITHDVDELQRRLGLPGMIVLQFALTGAIEGDFDPACIDPLTVVYTGTHDNNTTRGWFHEELLRCPEQLQRVRRFVPAHPDTIAWELIEAAWRSSGAIAIAPLQDLLNLGSEARMNRPGTTTAQHRNWSWRVPPRSFDRSVQERLAQLTAESGRLRPEAQTTIRAESPPA